MSNDDRMIVLLEEVRNLLIPRSDAFVDGYEQRQAVRGLVNASEKRRAAWKLSDGTRSQQEIVRESGMDSGNASRLFKELRAHGAITAEGNPTQTGVVVV